MTTPKCRKNTNVTNNKKARKAPKAPSKKDTYTHLAAGRTQACITIAEELKARCEKAADEDGVTLSYWFEHLAASAVGWKKPLSPARQRPLRR
jgi:hypothetical protein